MSCETGYPSSVRPVTLLSSSSLFVFSQGICVYSSDRFNARLLKDYHLLTCQYRSSLPLPITLLLISCRVRVYGGRATSITLLLTVLKISMPFQTHRIVAILVRFAKSMSPFLLSISPTFDRTLRLQAIPPFLPQLRSAHTKGIPQSASVSL